jgi:two-component system LytT family response regulator
MTIRAVIVDDTDLDRFNLGILLKHCPGVQCLAACPDPETGIEAINRLRPELVLLDVQMPGLSGFELLDRLAYTPWLIFVTAFDRYAIRAFEVNAVDYLLKPVQLERLQVAVARLSARLADAPLPLPTRMLEAGEPIFLKTGNRQFFAPVGQIVAIIAAGDCSEVHLCDRAPVEVRRRMNEWTDILPVALFLQLDRSLIVNRTRIREIERHGRSQARLHLAGLAKPIPIGRAALERLARSSESGLPPEPA